MTENGLVPTIWPTRFEPDPEAEIEIMEILRRRRSSDVAHCDCEEHPGMPCHVTVDVEVRR